MCRQHNKNSVRFARVPLSIGRVATETLGWPAERTVLEDHWIIEHRCRTLREVKTALGLCMQSTHATT